MTARAFITGVLLLLSPYAHSQCETKIYQDMLFVSAGPGCLAASGGREAIARGVKQVVRDLNDMSRSADPRERNMTSHDKLYRLAEIQHRDRVAHDLRVQNELRQSNHLARQQRGVN